MDIKYFYPNPKNFENRFANIIQNFIEENDLNVYYLYKVDWHEKMFAIIHFHDSGLCSDLKGSDLNHEFFLNYEKVQPTFSKTFKYSIPNKGTVDIQLTWIKFDRLSNFYFLTNGMINYLKLNKIKHSCILKKHINQFIRPRKKSLLNILSFVLRLFGITKKFNNALILVDRDYRANDNAEYLYRWISANKTHEKIFFALDKKSSDWKRLKQDGFNLIPIHSVEYFCAFIQADWIITSNITGYITKISWLKILKKRVKSRFCFLQHGVTKDYQPTLNRKHADIFITSADEEMNSIIQDTNNPYIYTKKEVKLTGMPRFDILHEKKSTKKNIILIMPTWRNNLVEDLVPHTGFRPYSTSFKESDFYNEWAKVLSNQRLRDLSTQCGLELKIYLHPYLHQQKADFLDFQNELVDENANVIDLIAECGLLITDYSSIAFDAAFISTPIIYYQFDKETFFNTHTYQKGYFDYEKHGFGPVCYNIETLNQQLNNILHHGLKMDDIYIYRKNAFFKYFDSGSCSRIYQELRKKTEVHENMRTT